MRKNYGVADRTLAWYIIVIPIPNKTIEVKRNRLKIPGDTGIWGRQNYLPDIQNFHENWEDWDREIPVDHRYAVVVAEEMSLDLIGPAAHTPSVMESMIKCAKGAYISTQLTAFIANPGSEVKRPLITCAIIRLFCRHWLLMPDWGRSAAPDI